MARSASHLRRVIPAQLLGHALSVARNAALGSDMPRDSLGTMLLRLFSSTFRALRRLCLRRGLEARDLIPRQQLEHMAGAPPGTWIATGPDPQFIASCRLPCGWVRVRLKMSCPGRAQWELFAGTGIGILAAECIERSDFRGQYQREFFVNMSRPTFAVRFDPLSGEGVFRIENLEIKPVSRIRLSILAFRSKLLEAWTAGRVIAVLKCGLAMLARGRLSELKRKLLKSLNGPSAAAPPPYDANAAYEAWLRGKKLTDHDRVQMRTQARALINPPRFSVLIPVCHGSERNLGLALESVVRQAYPHWEVCVVAYGQATPFVGAVLEDYRHDPRIRVRSFEDRQSRSAALSAGLEMVKGNFHAILRPDDELAEHALWRAAQIVDANPDVDMIYSDEDKIDARGLRSTPFFKPAWSPEYQLSSGYTGRLAVYRTRLVHELGSYRKECEGAEEFDLALRIAARSARIEHIADILYHERLPEEPNVGKSSRDQADEAARRAVSRYLASTALEGTVAAGPERGLHRVRFSISAHDRVSIIIATAYRRTTIHAKKTTLLARCLASIFAKTTYPHYEIVLLDNGDIPTDVIPEMERRGVRRMPYDTPFNWSAAMNEGARLANGEHLLFLNDDTEVISVQWLEALLEYSQQPGVGAVGPRLLFPDGRIQHVGIAILDGRPVHSFYGQPGDHPGYMQGNLVPHNCSAVTGACLMTRKGVFREVGGFTESLDLNYNDIDYCLKVAARGRRTVFTPHASLWHHEAATKPGLFPRELDAFQDRWRGRLTRDPYYNSSLSTRFADYRIELPC